MDPIDEENDPSFDMEQPGRQEEVDTNSNEEEETPPVDVEAAANMSDDVEQAASKILNITKGTDDDEDETSEEDRLAAEKNEEKKKKGQTTSSRRKKWLSLSSTSCYGCCCVAAAVLLSVVIIGMVLLIVRFVVIPNVDSASSSASNVTNTSSTVTATPGNNGQQGNGEGTDTISAPTLAPGQLPTLEPTISARTAILLNAISQVTPDSVLNDPLTPQYAALDWMINEDPAIVYDQARFIQRYSLVVLDKSLGRGALNASLHECRWTGVSCLYNGTETNTVRSIKWPGRTLQGTIPDEIGSLQKLVSLDLGENMINGTIPDTLYDLAELKDLYLHRNRLSGSISDRISNMRNLVNFVAARNRLNGTFPQGFASPGQNPVSSRPLRVLSLYDNDIGGTLPNFLNLRQLYYLDLSNNRMSGTIPNDWVEGNSKFVFLRHLFLDHNQFFGTLPSLLTTIGNGRLQQLALNDNAFVGEVPGKFDPVNFIQAIHLENNRFDSISKDICETSIFISGEVVEFNADCGICECQELCANC